MLEEESNLFSLVQDAAEVQVDYFFNLEHGNL